MYALWKRGASQRVWRVNKGAQWGMDPSYSQQPFSGLGNGES
jgi:hypothetical protein